MKEPVIYVPLGKITEFAVDHRDYIPPVLRGEEDLVEICGYNYGEFLLARNESQYPPKLK